MTTITTMHMHRWVLVYTGKLSKAEFFVAVKLIALRQSKVRSVLPSK